MPNIEDGNFKKGFSMSKIIKTKKEYKIALAEIESLIDIDPKSGTPECDRLELLALLVENYESERFRISLPDPIEAIKFRMEQQNLTQRDLIPFLGGRSKVSEVLSRTRPLTLSMIRALYSNLGIPAKVLLQDRDILDLEDSELEWTRFPLKVMISRGWIKAKVNDIRGQAEEVLRDYFRNLGSAKEIYALYRQTNNQRSARAMDAYALTAWTARVMMKANELKLKKSYKQNTINLKLMHQVARFSCLEAGPLIAQRFLHKYGICLVIEPHLPRTYLDGAAIMGDRKKPVIGLTLRHDRIDNFWFCLMHELAHIALHIDEQVPQFYDDLEVDCQDDIREKQADELAGEALIPQEIWEKSPARKWRSPEAAEHLAELLGVHPAIVAGRMRYEFKAYRLLNNLVGHGQVRRHFSEINWEVK